MQRFCRHPFLAAMLIFPLVLCACASQRRSEPQPQTSASLGSQLDEALGRGKTGAGHYTARVIDLASGRELYSVDADTPYMPASNGKLAPGAATLDFYGADYPMKTYLAVDGADLWLIGTGDPGIGDNMLAKKTGGTTMTVLDDFAVALKKRGISEIRGNLYYYDRAFDDQWTHPSWSKSYITDWYAAAISGLNFNNNCIDVSVKPTKTGEPVTYTVIPPTKGVQIVNKCVTGSAGDAPDVDRKVDADVFTVTGATTKPVDIKSEAVVNPGEFFADALRTHLASKGITIAGETRRAEKPLGESLAPPASKIVAVHETRLADALKRINKQSQNNFAEGFCKLLGRGYREQQGLPEPGSWPAGAEATKAFLARNHIDASKIEIVDGSGLSRSNRVTSRMISDLLVVMAKHKDRKAWFDSLGISGEDGTISKRMTDLKGRVHAKTGFIGGVRSLSGYVQNDDGHWIVFSIIYNGIGAVKPYEERQDNACRILAAWPRPAKLTPISRPTTNTTTNAAGE